MRSCRCQCALFCRSCRRPHLAVTYTIAHVSTLGPRGGTHVAGGDHGVHYQRGPPRTVSSTSASKTCIAGKKEAMQLKLVGSLLPLSSAYVILPGMHKYPDRPAFGIRWNSPTKRDTWPKNTVNDGLAGGLAFAYSPSFDAFCDGLVDQMLENTATIKWANCEEIENAVMRAMATWEANHQVIKFVDVTQACARDPSVDDMRNCSLAEIVLTSGAPDSSASRVAALVTHYSKVWGYPGRVGPSSTAGIRATADYTIEKVCHRKTTPACA